MTSLRTLIVFKSIHHQNTARIATAIADVLDAQLHSLDDLTPRQISDFDIIGFGSGIYFGQFHKSLREWIDALPTASCRGRKAFVFSTSGLPALSWIWNWPLRARLQQKEFDVVGEFHCSGFDTVGPLRWLGGLNRRHPSQLDLKHAAAFAHQLVNRFSTVKRRQTLCSSS